MQQPKFTFAAAFDQTQDSWPPSTQDSPPQENSTISMLSDLTPNEHLSEYYGPRGFHWLVPGLLGGAQRPGLMYDMDIDLEGLKRVGTRVLVTLTEEWQPNAEEMARYGIESLYVPIPDREPPTLQQAIDTCEFVDRRINRGEAVVHHCRAGKGRTGTLLAAQLIWRGSTTEQAIKFAREKFSLWIESESQENWLFEFGAHCHQKLHTTTA